METKGRLYQSAPEYMGGVRVDVRRCDDCGTTFTANLGRPFTINGVMNDGLCPWCRPDSEPWKNGRGL